MKVKYSYANLTTNRNFSFNLIASFKQTIPSFEQKVYACQLRLKRKELQIRRVKNYTFSLLHHWIHDMSLEERNCIAFNCVVKRSVDIEIQLYSPHLQLNSGFQKKINIQKYINFVFINQNMFQRIAKLITIIYKILPPVN